jgi:predicted hydrocarbon binding protein
LFVNWRENVKLITDWFRDNWQNMLLDAGKIVINFVKNLPENLKVALRAGIRVWVEFQGFVTDVFHHIAKSFSDNLISAFGVVATHAKTFAKGLAKAMINAAKGKTSVRELGAFIGSEAVKQASERAARDKGNTLASLAEDFAKTSGEILAEEWEKLDFLKGVDFSTTAFPKLRTDIKNLFGEAGKDAGKAMGKNMSEEVKNALEGAKISPVRVPIQLTTVQAIDVGSLQDLILLAGIPTIPIPSKPIVPKVGRGATAEANRAQAVARTNIARAQAGDTGPAGAAAGAFVKQSAQGVRDTAISTGKMVGLLQRIALNTALQLEKANTLDVENADLEFGAIFD